MKASSVHNDSEWFTAASAAKLAGLTPAMTNYLCRQNIVEPSCSCPRGHGRKRHYSFGDVVALRLVAKLSATGASVLRLKAGMHYLRKFHPEITLSSLPASHVVTDGQALYLRKPGEPLERMIDGQLAFAFVVELSQLQTEVAEALTKLKAA